MIEHDVIDLFSTVINYCGGRLEITRSDCFFFDVKLQPLPLKLWSYESELPYNESAHFIYFISEKKVQNLQKLVYNIISYLLCPNKEPIPLTITGT